MAVTSGPGPGARARRRRPRPRRCPVRSDGSCSQRSAVHPTCVTSRPQTGHWVVQPMWTRCRRRVTGPPFTILPNQKRPTVGAPTACARWRGPLSLPTNTSATESSPTSSTQRELPCERGDGCLGGHRIGERGIRPVTDDDDSPPIVSAPPGQLGEPLAGPPPPGVGGTGMHHDEAGRVSARSRAEPPRAPRLARRRAARVRPRAPPPAPRPPATGRSRAGSTGTAATARGTGRRGSRCPRCAGRRWRAAAGSSCGPPPWSWHARSKRSARSRSWKTSDRGGVVRPRRVCPARPEAARHRLRGPACRRAVPSRRACRAA